MESPVLNPAMSEQYTGVGSRFQKHTQAKHAGLRFTPESGSNGYAGTNDASANAAAGGGNGDADGTKFEEKSVVEGIDGWRAARMLMQDVTQVAILCGARGAFTSRPGGAADPNPNRTQARNAAAKAAANNDGGGGTSGSGVAAGGTDPAR